MSSGKRSVFISYAHKDAMDFTRRLAFALSLHMDVFWDKEGLRVGPWEEQLLNEIEKRGILSICLVARLIA